MIPVRFKILGQDFKVVFDDELCKKEGSYGMYFPSLNKLVLSKRFEENNEIVDLDEDFIKHTFYHELIHAILNVMQEKELYENERFIDIFAGILLQIEKTSEYETDKSKRKPRTTNPRRTSPTKSIRESNKKTKKKG